MVSPVLDTIVTLDDAASAHHSMHFVKEDGTAIRVRGVRAKAILCAGSLPISPLCDKDGAGTLPVPGDGS